MYRNSFFSPQMFYPFEKRNCTCFFFYRKKIFTKENLLGLLFSQTKENIFMKNMTSWKKKCFYTVSYTEIIIKKFFSHLEKQEIKKNKKFHLVPHTGNSLWKNVCFTWFLVRKSMNFLVRK